MENRTNNKMIHAELYVCLLNFKAVIYK